MAELFGVEVPTVSYHLKEIYPARELVPEATLRKILRVQRETSSVGGACSYPKFSDNFRESGGSSSSRTSNSCRWPNQRVGTNAMSWLLFLDESGHDHKTMPYEVRGGLALHAGKLWPFVQELQRRELSAFGTELRQFGKELKGCKLLDKDRFRWAAQAEAMSDQERRKLCRSFLTKGLEKKPPTRAEFTAYGQACVDFANGIFEALRDHDAKLFATAIPRSVRKPASFKAENYLRKDQVYLLERYYYLLERDTQHGLIVMDEVEKTDDRRFVSRLESYYRRTMIGRYRSAWVVPTPFFVSSDMATPIQAADLAIYCVNWGFRLPARGMDAPVRQEIADRFGPWINQLQFRGQGYRDGRRYETFGIVYVPDPYVAGA